MPFPLYHRPSSILFLDDESPYLEMLAFVLPEHWNTQFHTRAGDFLAQVSESARIWEHDVHRHTEMLSQWHRGHSLPQLVLNYWADQLGRYGLPSIAVVDYAMPAGNGVDVLRDAPPWPTWRVLLTGRADEHTAVKAFNDGLIHRFITKQAPDLAVTLIDLLQQLHDAPMPRYESIWQSALSPAQRACVSAPAHQTALANWIRAKRCCEHFVLPAPFGVLGMDAQGQMHWLQLELRADLPAAAELAQSAGCDAATCNGIARGLYLCDAEVRLSLGLPLPVRTAPARTASHDSDLFMASFDLDEVGHVAHSYAQHLRTMPQRGIDRDAQSGAAHPVV